MPVELAAFDQLVDADDLLLDDAPRAHVEVPDLGRPLIPRPQPDGPPGGAEDGVRVRREQLAENRRVGEGDGVAGVLASDPPAVADDQDDGSSHPAHLTSAAAPVQRPIQRPKFFS